jgi:hypothetical protein
LTVSSPGTRVPLLLAVLDTDSSGAPVIVDWLAAVAETETAWPFVPPPPGNT